jgi:hypothetical protein
MYFDILSRTLILPLVALALLAPLPACFAAEGAEAQEVDCPASAAASRGQE